MNRLSVTPIGTCRINTPLKRAQSRFPVELNFKRNYGYTHTSDEALQQLRFLQGDKQFREEVRPVLFRPDNGRAIDSERWEPSDLHIVEVSSAKKISSGEDPVQINYLYRHFADFFSSSARTSKFWSLVKRRARADLLEFLRAEPTYRMMSPQDRALLTSLRIEQQDFAAIKADMAEIVERLGREKLLFVTHVNAQTPDGSIIPTRDRVIRWVKLAAEQLAVPCFDPTQIMIEFGQERAMEQGGLDLTHFTPAFSDRVYAELHREHVGRLMELRTDLAGDEDGSIRRQMLADNIEALMRFDDFRSGSRRLFAALRKEPDSLPLIQLRGRVLADLGDFEGAIRDLAQVERSSLSPDSRAALLEALTETHSWSAAIEVAEGLLGDEFESGKIYQCAATACEQLGRTEEALNHWKQAFRHDRTNLNAALRGLALLSMLGIADKLGTWREEVLEHARNSTTGGSDIAKWALENRDEELLSKVFGGIVQRDYFRAEELLGEIARAGLTKAESACITQLLQHNDPATARQRQLLAARSGKLAAELLAAGDVKSAHVLADAVLQARPDRLADRTRRVAQSHYRKAIREAHARKDCQVVMAVWEEANSILREDPNAMVIAAQSLHRLEHNGAALRLLMEARELAPEDVNVLRWLGRISAMMGRYDIALPSYAELRRSSDPAAKKFSAETDRFFTTADRRAIKQVREAIAAGEFELALELGDLLQDHIGDREQLELELGRVNRMLRVQLREIEKGDADEDGRERVLSLLLTMQPDDAAILRRAALEMMRQMKFRVAAELWARVDRVAPGTESNVRNIERCRTLAARQEKSSTAANLTVAR